MRTCILIVCLAALGTGSVLGVSCSSTTASPSPAGERLGSEDLTSYAIGYSLGERVLNGLAADGVDAETGVIIRGFQDALADADPVFEADALQAELFRIQEELERRQTEDLLANNAEFRALADAKLAASRAFMAENGARPGVQTGPRGGQWEVLRDASGPVPSERDTVVVNYVGTLADGTVFQQDEGHLVEIDTTIDGAREVLTSMPVGAKWRLFVPPELGYGVVGQPPAVGPNEVLVIDVELVRIVGGEG